MQDRNIIYLLHLVLQFQLPEISCSIPPVHSSRQLIGAGLQRYITISCQIQHAGVIEGTHRYFLHLHCTDQSSVFFFFYCLILEHCYGVLATVILLFRSNVADTTRLGPVRGKLPLLSVVSAPLPSSPGMSKLFSGVIALSSLRHRKNTPATIKITAATPPTVTPRMTARLRLSLLLPGVLRLPDLPLLSIFGSDCTNIHAGPGYFFLQMYSIEHEKRYVRIEA